MVLDIMRRLLWTLADEEVEGIIKERDPHPFAHRLAVSVPL